MPPQLNHPQIALVLFGEGSYDALGEQEQAVVRVEWEARVTARRDELD